MAEPTEPAFEVLDALDGFCHLERRDRSLDGSVPLRVMQGCVPFLEGNAFGFQIVLQKPMHIERHLGAWWFAPDPAHVHSLRRSLDANLPRLQAQGFLSSAWATHLQRSSFYWDEGGLRGPRLRLWTGLLVRPLRGRWLRVSDATNRRCTAVSMETFYMEESDRFTPLVLSFRPKHPDRIRLQEEIATLAPLAPRVRFEQAPLAQDPGVGEAHGRFYDAAYFATKKGEITRKYRKLVQHQGEQEDEGGEATARLIHAAPARFLSHAIEPAGPFLGPSSTAPAPAPRGPGRLEQVLFRNLVTFRTSFDGHTVTTDPDWGVLPEAAAGIEKNFTEALGKPFVEEHRGALWYLTKYFTPHPPGEPHFFVKPWSFVVTPPGWSCLLDGVHGEGYDILRGVVSTDQFHATPAVFWIHTLHRTLRVPHGAPLLRVIPVPRALLREGFRTVSFLDVAPPSSALEPRS
ncbi:MAG: hypothetical protein MUF64_04090 [Polyangiaceae bacterium]|nr:hypothetical protein [Polyangiaceae bacterium]